MDLAFKSNKLKKQLTNPTELVKAYGQLAKKINQRLSEFKAAENLSIIQKIPGTRLHGLSGDRNGEFAVNVSKIYRIIFVPYHDPIPETPEGGVDLTLINCIKITEIENYH